MLVRWSWRVLVIATLLVTSLGASFRPLFACQPTQAPTDFAPTPFTVAMHAKRAAIIFEGTVLGQSARASSNSSYLGEIRVQQYLKGSGPALVEVSGFSTGGDCRPVAYPGLHAIFYVSVDDNSQWQLDLGPIGTAMVDSVDAKTLSQITNTVGQAPITPEPKFDFPLAPATPVPWICWAGCLVSVLVIGGVIAIGVYQRRASQRI